MSRSSLLLLTALFLCIAGAPAVAQSIFTVTVAAKTSAHPYFGQGWSEGYVVDGVEGKEIVVMRGTTYTFQMSSVPTIHPFYISTSAEGGGVGVYGEGVTNNFASGDATLTFTPTAATPDLLYYQCGVHTMMGYRILVQSSASVDRTDGAGRAMSIAAWPNPFESASTVMVRGAGKGFARVALYDMLGRQAQLLYDGTGATGEMRLSIDASALAPGAYELRATIDGATTSTRIVKIR